VYTRVSESISAFLNHNGLGIDNFWPKSGLTGDSRAALNDGLRFPSSRKHGARRYSSAKRRAAPWASDLLESARDCPFCELLRVAIILGSNREYGYPVDRPKEELGPIIRSIRLGAASDQFELALEGFGKAKVPSI
jgi:hypothetical protein